MAPDGYPWGLRTMVGTAHGEASPGQSERVRVAALTCCTWSGRHGRMDGRTRSSQTRPNSSDGKEKQRGRRRREEAGLAQEQGFEPGRLFDRPPQVPRYVGEGGDKKRDSAALPEPHWKMS